MPREALIYSYCIYDSIEGQAKLISGLVLYTRSAYYMLIKMYIFLFIYLLNCLADCPVGYAQP